MKNRKITIVLVFLLTAIVIFTCLVIYYENHVPTPSLEKLTLAKIKIIYLASCVYHERYHGFSENNILNALLKEKLIQKNDIYNAWNKMFSISYDSNTGLLRICSDHKKSSEGKNDIIKEFKIP